MQAAQATPSPCARLFTAWRRDAALRRKVGRAAIVLVLALLWLYADRNFGYTSVDSFCRFDFGSAAAYPVSDAGCDFQNALAMRSGDGWVNWRETNRWTVYKPGWAALLGGVGLVTDFEPARMQRILTFLFAAVVPGFFLLVCVLFPGRFTPPVALFAALAFLRYPLTGTWWFTQCMMTEGPTLLLAVVTCWLAVRAAARRRWIWHHGLWVGLAAGAVAMVRSQARYAAVLLACGLLIGALRRWRARVAFLVLFTVGFLALQGPYLLKSSVHLGRPFYGASVLDLWAILAWTRVGQEVGGKSIDPSSFPSETAALDAMWAKTQEAVALNLQAPWPPLAEGWSRLRSYALGVPAALLGVRREDPGLVWRVMTLAAVGLLAATLRWGAVAWVPLLFALGYMGPLVATNYYLPRFGVPISWLGLLYGLGGILAIADPSQRRPAVRRLRSLARVARRAWQQRLLPWLRRDASRPRSATFPARHRARPPQSSAEAWPKKVVLLSIAAYLAVTTGCLLWVDAAPLHRPSAERLLADGRVQAAFIAAGVTVDNTLREQITLALAGAGDERRVMLGVAHLPILVRPHDKAARNTWFNVDPWDREYTAVLLASGWKASPRRFVLHQLAIDGRIYDGFSNGDWVLAVVDETLRPGPHAWTEFAYPVRARAIVPLRWGG